MVNVEEEEDDLLVLMHVQSRKKKLRILSLRPFEIIDYSSQYGSERSTSYTVHNFVGSPSVYPRFGDHPYSFQLRTYGQWWLNLPSYPKSSIKLPFNISAESQDFLEFRLEQKIVPILIRIYEIYNPGAIVKILSFCYEAERWIVLWKGSPQFLNSNSSHCFSVNFENVHHLSDFYRIEFHHKHLKYFCELDCGILYGEDESNVPNSPKKNHASEEVNVINNSKIENEMCVENSESYFDVLPLETVIGIMRYLDLQSLCRASAVSKLFKKACYDPTLYKELDLQMYWHQVDEYTLKAMLPRLSSLKHLNLSWCGGQFRITPTYFTEFIETRCWHLSVLKISCCIFLDSNCMKAIGSYCQNLEVLDMRGCRYKDLKQSGFKFITLLSKLKYLDLYRTLIDTSSMIAIIKSCSNLEHLLMGSCINIDTFDEVAQAIAKNLRYIKTLDFWRASSLTCVGVLGLAQNCHDLIELDLGWCGKIDAICGCLRQLISHNHKLKKLILSAIRSVSNNEIDAVADNCKDLEQLDILGTRAVDLMTIRRLLGSCSNLKLLDVSYCAKSVKEAVPVLQEYFPSVEIKCSIPPDMNY